MWLQEEVITGDRHFHRIYNGIDYSSFPQDSTEFLTVSFSKRQISIACWNLYLPLNLELQFIFTYLEKHYNFQVSQQVLWWNYKNS